MYTLILYWGEKEWDAKDSLQEIVDIPVADVRAEKRLRELLPDYRIHVYDLNKLKDFSAFKTSLRTLFEFYSYREDGEGMESYMKSNREAVAGLDSESTFLLSVMLGEDRLMKQLHEQKKKKEEDAENINDKGETNVCKAIDEMIEKGVKRGIEEGKIEGKIESIFELLSDLGEISETIRDKICKENNLTVMNRWLKLAAKSSTIDEFEAAM